MSPQLLTNVNAASRLLKSLCREWDLAYDAWKAAADPAQKKALGIVVAGLEMALDGMYRFEPKFENEGGR